MGVRGGGAPARSGAQWRPRALATAYGAPPPRAPAAAAAPRPSVPAAAPRGSGGARVLWNGGGGGAAGGVLVVGGDGGDAAVERAAFRAANGGVRTRPRAEAPRARAASRAMRLQLPPSERAFFDRAKRALGSDDAWLQFLKVLDLYASEVITLPELITLVDDFLGDEHGAVLDDLKRLLNTRGVYSLSDQDLWYSLPLSEIDFSRCRRAMPSYRALPSAYPAPKCRCGARLCLGGGRGM